MNYCSKEQQADIVYYRPPWTCGRYTQNKHVAIMYNLIEGYVYFFEDISADVIGRLLHFRRNEEFSLSRWSQETHVPEHEIETFATLLESLGLVCTECPSPGYIHEYREQAKLKRKRDKQGLTISSDGEGNSAEKAYFEAIKAPNTITNVMFELTYNCSEKCLHCYNPGATRNNDEKSFRHEREELTLQDYKRIIDELKELGVVKVCLSGGDPFSKNIVWDIIDYLYQQEIAVDIFTNGQKLKGQEQKLSNYYPRLVGLSLYSGVPEDHDTITRIQGSQKKTVDVMEELGKLGIPMNLKCCVMRPNVKSYYTVKEIAERTGAVPQFELNITDSVEGDKCASRHLRLTPEMMEIVLRDEYIEQSLNLREIASKEMVIELGDKVCGAGENSFCITPEGNLQPCCAFPLVLGNLRRNSLVEILNDNDTLHEWRSVTFSNFPECYTHDYCVYCRLCPGNNHVTNGTPFKPSENNCTIAKIKHTLALKLKSGLDPLQGLTLKERLSQIDNREEILHREFK